MISPGTANDSSPLHVRVVESGLELASLGDEWERLQKDAAVTSVFASFDWQRLWWQFYGRGQPLRLLVATEGGVPVGILPLYIQTEPALRYPVRLLRLVGAGGDTSPDDLGPLLARSREPEVARALADAVMKLPDWDVMLLTDLDPTCAFTPAMEAAARNAGLECRAGTCVNITFVDLPATFEAWLQSLHRDRRYRVRNVRKKFIAAHPTARFFVWDDPATLDRGMDQLVRLHHKRWERAGQAHGFSSAEYVGFHRSVMAACLRRDRLRLYCLEVADEVVAIFYFYKFRDRVFLMQSGFDPDYSKSKPGQVLLGYALEHAIGEGHKVLDFLRGDHQYKDELATGKRETVYLTAFRQRPGAWVYRARRIYLPRLKAYVIQALEQRVRCKPAPTVG